MTDEHSASCDVSILVDRKSLGDWSYDATADRRAERRRANCAPASANAFVAGLTTSWMATCASPDEVCAAQHGLLPCRGTTPQAQHPAGRNETMGGHKLLHAGHQVLPFLSSGVAKPSSTANFFGLR
jgi:hypothetical protein